MIILSRSKTVEEREFYLKLVRQENYSSRELERQISSGTFERVMVGNQKLSAVLREFIRATWLKKRSANMPRRRNKNISLPQIHEITRINS